MMKKLIRTLVISLLIVALAAGSAFAEPKEKQPPGQDQKAEQQQAKEDREAAKAAEKAEKEEPKEGKQQPDPHGKADEPHGKADEPHGKADEHHGKADEPHGKPDKGSKKDVTPGNNGTIKIDGEPFDGSHGNEPHVGCTFSLNFFNFDEATKSSTVVFEGHASSGGGVLLVDDVTFSGNKTTASYALSEFDQAALASATPHPQQGYHVRVTTSTDYSNGADRKSKVFWIDCPVSAAIAPVVPPRAPAGPVDLAPMQPEPKEVDEEVLGIQFTRPQAVAPPRAVAPAEAQGTEIFGLALPFTGAGVTVLLLFGLVLVAAGMFVVSRRRA